MFAIVWGLAYFLAIYLFEMQADPLTSQLGMSALHAMAAFFGAPFFLRYFEAQRNNSDPMLKLEQTCFCLSALAIGTGGGIVTSPTLFPTILGGFYVFVFIVFNKALDESYRRIGIYSQEYYTRVMGEFPLRSRKLISQFRVLIYVLPLMLLVALSFWQKG